MTSIPLGSGSISISPLRAGAPEVYVASPLGFDAPGRRFSSEILLPALRSAGIVPLDPWDDPDQAIASALGIADPDQRRAALIEANRRIGGRNEDLLRHCAGVLAILDGSDVDSGTAAEVGFASALGRPVVGVRTDLRQAGDNEATIVNLQIEWFIAISGGLITASVDSGVAALATLLALRP